MILLLPHAAAAALCCHRCGGPGTGARTCQLTRCPLSPPFPCVRKQGRADRKWFCVSEPGVRDVDDVITTAQLGNIQQEQCGIALPDLREGAPDSPGRAGGGLWRSSALYADLLGEPLGHKAHELLHTHCVAGGAEAEYGTYAARGPAGSSVALAVGWCRLTLAPACSLLHKHASKG